MASVKNTGLRIFLDGYELADVIAYYDSPIFETDEARAFYAGWSAHEQATK